eukprot:TRINITY_DN6941_c0_g1_i1.p1 TRINITY_DN6941_c0_g1~~TRINITY_DN6941_c0_g1_i1.p1  ORF type:complete len:544 (+),score=91.28 TRINITY_DN6941_c0_g1_i1:57-1634(+)
MAGVEVRAPSPCGRRAKEKMDGLRLPEEAFRKDSRLTASSSDAQSSSHGMLDATSSGGTRSARPSKVSTATSGLAPPEFVIDAPPKSQEPSPFASYKAALGSNPPPLPPDPQCILTLTPTSPRGDESPVRRQLSGVWGSKAPSRAASFRSAPRSPGGFLTKSVWEREVALSSHSSPSESVITESDGLSASLPGSSLPRHSRDTLPEADPHRPAATPHRPASTPPEVSLSVSRLSGSRLGKLWGERSLKCDDRAGPASSQQGLFRTVERATSDFYAEGFAPKVPPTEEPQQEVGSPRRGVQRPADETSVLQRWKSTMRGWSENGRPQPVERDVSDFYAEGFAPKDAVPRPAKRSTSPQAEQTAWGSSVPAAQRGWSRSIPQSSEERDISDFYAEGFAPKSSPNSSPKLPEDRHRGRGQGSPPQASLHVSSPTERDVSKIYAEGAQRESGVQVQGADAADAAAPPPRAVLPAVEMIDTMTEYIPTPVNAQATATGRRDKLKAASMSHGEDCARRRHRRPRNPCCIVS